MSTPPLEPIAAPLYDPRFEHDACGVGFVADLRGASPRVVPMALEALAALAHRGARGADVRTGDATDALFATDNFKAGLLIGQYAKAVMGDTEPIIATIDGSTGVSVRRACASMRSRRLE